MAAATSSSASPAPVVRWEVEMDAGWGRFDAAAEAHLEKTHGKGQKTTTLRTNGFTYRVNFDQMTQTNTQTSRKRNIRRVTVSAGSGGAGEWQVELDGSQWTAYDASVQAQLNAAQARGDNDAIVTVRGTTYQIGLQPPEVQINISTGFRRRVRCMMTIDSDGGSGSDGTVGAGPAVTAPGPAGAGGGGGGGAAAAPVVPALTRPPTCTGRKNGKNETLTFDAGDGAVDFGQVTEWQVLRPGAEYDPRMECRITNDVLGTDAPVVKLTCDGTGGQHRCIFRQEVISKALAVNPTCPSCNHRFVLPGPQPSGTMRVEKSRSSCEGFASVGTWNITYDFPNGTQTALHQSPGVRYSGTRRHVYVPDTAEGRTCVELLKRGFERGHLFTIGTSVTTGQKNTVVWSSVHQKTSPSGGPTQHGWPDEGAFERCQHELAAKGIFTPEVERDQANARRAAAAAAATTTSSSSSSSSPPAPTNNGAAAAPTGPTAAQQQELDRINAEIKIASARGDRARIRELMNQRKEQQQAVA